MDVFDKLKEAIKKSANSFANGLAGKIYNNVSSYLNKLGDKVNVDNGLESKLKSPHDIAFYDMKPAFSHSSRVKYTPAGNWYLIVPIHRKTTSMNSYVFKQAMAMQESLSGTTDYINDLYGDRNPTDSPFGVIPYNLNTGGNLTRYDNTSTSFIAFRTVSANSPQNSWIRRIDTSASEENKSLVNTLDDLIRRTIDRI
mgnify:CR=1 FL=1